ncbi:MAG: glycosyltransferase family 4 protein [Bacteroidota bacterium]
MSKHILLLGPLPNENPNSVGGATNSFKILTDFFKEKSHPHTVVCLNPSDSKIKSLLQMSSHYLSRLAQSDIAMLNFNQIGFKYIAPVLYVIAKMLGKQVALRIFGGDAVDLYRQSNSLHRWMLRQTVLKSDLVLLQTKMSLDYFKKHTKRQDWLPTSRYQPAETKKSNDFQKRFVFISHIKSTKGIDEILAVKKQLPDDFIIDLYGPIKEEKYTCLLQGATCYKGSLKKEEVAEVLSQYDVLLLPTYHEGEGYPGIIIEAYALGIPCITTDWMAIPEIVKHGETGLLIPPKNSNALKAAILSFSEDNYSTFHEKAKSHFQHFDADKINTALYQKLQAL